MPPDFPLFPSRDQMRDYILGFAADQAWDRHPLQHGGDRRRDRSTRRPRGLGDRDLRGERRTYDGVIVANGHLWDPLVPDVPRALRRAGAALGRYRNAGDLRATACSSSAPGTPAAISLDAAQAGRETYVSVRGGLVFQPKTLFGRPRSELPLLARLPVRAPGACDPRAHRPRSARPSTTACRRRPREPAPQPPGRQRPAPALHPPRPRPCRAGHRALRRPRRALHRRHRPRVRHDRLRDRLQGRRCRSWMRRRSARRRRPPARRRDDAPGRPERLYFVGLAAPRGPQLPVYSAQTRLIAQVPDRPERRGRRAVGALRRRRARGADRHPPPRVAARHGPRAPAASSRVPRASSAAGSAHHPPPRADSPGGPRMTRARGQDGADHGGARGQGAAHGRRLAEEGAAVVLGDVLDAARLRCACVPTASTRASGAST